MLKLFRTPAAVIAATSVGLIFTAAPAGAASTTARLSSRAATHTVGASPFANAQNTGFAGYSSPTGTTTYASVSSSFKLPALTGCGTGTGNQGINPGVQLVSSSSGAYSGGAVFAYCNGSTPAYLANLTINSTEHNLPLAMAAGDKISVSVSETATATTVKVADATSKASATDTATLGGTMDSFNIGDGLVLFGGVLAGVPAFGKVSFTGNKVNGGTLSAAGAIAVDRVSTATNPPTVQIKTGLLSTTGSFTTTFKHS